MKVLIEKLKNNKNNIYNKLIFVLETIASLFLGICIYKVLYL